MGCWPSFLLSLNGARLVGRSCRASPPRADVLVERLLDQLAHRGLAAGPAEDVDLDVGQVDELVAPYVEGVADALHHRERLEWLDGAAFVRAIVRTCLAARAVAALR